MDNFYARAVFFVKDAERSLAFYTEKLGFSLDWNYQYEGRAWVFEVSLHGFCLILNQAALENAPKAGHGRVFIGLEEDQSQVLLKHIRDKGIETTSDNWGRETLVIKDLDQNELYFWLTPPTSE